MVYSQTNKSGLAYDKETVEVERPGRPNLSASSKEDNLDRIHQLYSPRSSSHILHHRKTHTAMKSNFQSTLLAIDFSLQVS